MARYNSSVPATTITTTTSQTAPNQGLFTEFTGTAPYTVTIPDPTIFNGQTQTFYNATSGVITLSTPTGVFNGPGGSTTSTQAIVSGGTVILASDGSNYVQVLGSGGPINGTTITTTGNASIGGTNSNIQINPTGTGYVAITASSGNLAIGTAGSATLRVLGNLVVVGRETSITQPISSGNYTYDGNNRITQFVDGNKTTSSITYDGSNRISGFTETITDSYSGATYTQSRTVTYTSQGDPIIT
jgi:YD repeat-containing protein